MKDREYYENRLVNKIEETSEVTKANELLNLGWELSHVSSHKGIAKYILVKRGKND